MIAGLDFGKWERLASVFIANAVPDGSENDTTLLSTLPLTLSIAVGIYNYAKGSADCTFSIFNLLSLSEFVYQSPGTDPLRTASR